MDPFVTMFCSFVFIAKAAAVCHQPVHPAATVQQFSLSNPHYRHPFRWRVTQLKVNGGQRLADPFYDCVCGQPRRVYSR